MHCTDPVAPCAQVGPVDAILVSDDGVVHSPDASRCIGCQNCVHGCPWGVPKFDVEEQLAYKCNLCYDRTSVGLGPMCATVCPSDALYYGTADERSEEHTPELQSLMRISYAVFCLKKNKTTN